MGVLFQAVKKGMSMVSLSPTLSILLLVDLIFLSFLFSLSSLLFLSFHLFPFLRERERVCLHTPTCTGSVIFGKVACVHVSYNIVINHKVLHFNLVLYGRPHHHGVPLYDREGSCSPKQTYARCKTWCFSCFE